MKYKRKAKRKKKTVRIKWKNEGYVNIKLNKSKKIRNDLKIKKWEGEEKKKEWRIWE